MVKTVMIWGLIFSHMLVSAPANDDTVSLTGADVMALVHQESQKKHSKSRG